jgi:hypothetical protein
MKRSLLTGTCCLAILFGSFFFARAQSVDPMTGRLQMGIDLFSISEGNIDVPVSISNSGTAMHVREGAGSSGVGWSLNAGGAVTRVVRGFPDDLPGKGWLFNGNAQSVQDFNSFPNDDYGSGNHADEASAWSFLNTAATTKDTEPDLYNISAPGLGVQFVLGADGQPKLLTYQDITITVTRSFQETISAFTVKTAQGLTYTFDNVQQVTRIAVPSINPSTGLQITPSYFKTRYDAYSTEASFAECWYLSRISSLSSSADAVFNYTSGEEEYTGQQVWQALSTAEKQYTINEKRIPQRVSSITLGGSTLNFVWNDQLINRVSLTVGSQSKAYHFVYHAVYWSNDGGPRVHRYFLKELKPEVNCLPFPAYEFKYHMVEFNPTGGTGVTVPIPTGDGEDAWGYYADPSLSSIRSFYFFPGANDGSRFQIVNTGGTGGAFQTSRYLQTSGDNTSLFGALNEISFPEGGVSKIQYEQNSYVDPISGQTVYGAGIRVKKLTTFAGGLAYARSASDQSLANAIERQYEYKLSDNNTSGKITYPPMLAFSTGGTLAGSKESLGEHSEVFYSRTTEVIPGKGRTVYEFALPGMYPQLTDGDWKATKSYVARSSGSVGIGNLKNGSYTYPYPPNTNYNLDRGKMNSVKVYAEGGANPIHEKIITNSRNPASPFVVYGIRYEKLGEVIHLGKYEIFTGLGSAVTQEITKVASEESPTQLQTTTTQYSYGGTPLALQQVTTTLPDGSQVKTHYKYARDFAITNPNGDAAYAIKQLNDTGRKSQLVETINYRTPVGGSEMVTGASLVLYKDFSGKIYPHQQYSFLNTSGFSESFLTPVGAQQKFEFDTDYKLIASVESYDAVGNAIDQIDDSKNRVSVHVATNLPVGPVATFSRAKTTQTVFEGFEVSTGRGLAISGGTPAYVAGWTGDRALQMTSAMILANTNVEKNGQNTFRVSCRVKAAQASTITFQARNGGTLVSGSPVALTYTAPQVNQWVYLEGVMNTTNANSTFGIEVVTSGTVSIDDMLVMPSTARVNLATYNALSGMTSQTDDRGNSVWQTYDPIGRPVNSLDRNKNLVARKEYKTQKTPVGSLDVVIESSSPTYLTATPYTFTAGNNCEPSLTYAWRMNGNSTILSTASTLNHTFTQTGLHTVELTITSATLGSFVHNRQICVEFNPAALPIISVENVSGITNPSPDQIVECLDTYTKRFTVSNLPTCSEGGSLQIAWAARQQGQEFWTTIIGNTNTVEYSASAINTTVRCIVLSICENGLPQCAGGTGVSRTIETNLTWVPNPNCQ